MLEKEDMTKKKNFMWEFEAQKENICTTIVEVTKGEKEFVNRSF